jgi:large subunit ribosomal protein L9
MEVLLRQTIEKLGQIGDVVTVKAGYARNYLLPTGRAALVNKNSLADIERDRVVAMAQEQLRVDTHKELAEALSKTSVTLEGNANEEGHLFGSVNAAQIAKALREKGFAIEDRMVRLEAPLKEIGVFDVSVHLHAEVETTTKVWVVQAKPD